MSSVLPLPSAKKNGRLHVPTLKETSLDPDDYLLRLAETLRIDLASSLGLPTSAIGSVESWVEQVEEFGLNEFLEDDRDCQENISSMDPQEVGAKLMEVMSEWQDTVNKDADSMIPVTKNSPEATRPNTLPANTNNPRKRCASYEYPADLQNGSFLKKSEETCNIKEPVTQTSNGGSKRQCLVLKSGYGQGGSGHGSWTNTRHII